MAARYSKQADPVGFANFMLRIIPHSFLGAFAEGEVLPVLLISILVAFGLNRVGDAGAPLMKGIDSFSQVLFASFGFIMKLAPLGAFGAMAFTVGRYGIRSIGSLGLLILTFYVACGAFIVLSLGLWPGSTASASGRRSDTFGKNCLSCSAPPLPSPRCPAHCASWSG